MKYNLSTIIAAITFGLAGCSSVSSKAVDYTDGKARAGLHYSAPKVLLSVELIKYDGELSVAISEPYYEGDPNATFTLQASSGTFSDQKYDFRVDPDTRLLSTIRSESQGRLDDVLVDIAKLAGGVSTFDERGGLGSQPVLYSRIIDPMMQSECGFGKYCQLTELMEDLKFSAEPHLECWDNPDKPLCRAIEKGEPPFIIELTPLFETGPGIRNAAQSKSCNDSVCYRAPVPYELRLRIAGVTDISQIVHMPNEGPILSLKLPAGLFADAKSYVGLVDGMPVLVRTDKESEAAVAAGVPFRAVNSFFSGVSEVVQLRVDYNNDRTRLDRSNDTRDEFVTEREERIARAEALLNSTGNDDEIEDDPAIPIGRNTDERGGLGDFEADANAPIEDVSTISAPQRNEAEGGSLSQTGKLLSATISTE